MVSKNITLPIAVQHFITPVDKPSNCFITLTVFYFLIWSSLTNLYYINRINLCKAISNMIKIWILFHCKCWSFFSKTRMVQLGVLPMRYEMCIILVKEYDGNLPNIKHCDLRKVRTYTRYICVVSLILQTNNYNNVCILFSTLSLLCLIFIACWTLHTYLCITNLVTLNFLR